MHNRTALRVALLVLLLWCGGLFAAEKQKSKWVQFTTPHFELYTDAGERKGRDALKRLDQLRQVLQYMPRSENAPQAPVRVFLFDNERDYRRFRRAEAGLGYGQSGADRDYLVMRGTGGDTYRTIAHEYTHLVFDRSRIRVPRWIEEGTAEYYSTIEPDGRARARVGKPIAGHQKLLRNSTLWLKPELFHGVRRDSIAYKEAMRSGIFYAQPWALVHMLMSSDSYKNSVPRYSELLTDGTAYAPAFMTAFGRPVESAWKELASYVRSNKFRVLRLNLAPDTVSSLKPRKASVADISLALAELLLVIGDHKQASALLVEVAAADETAEVLALRGMLALKTRKLDAARESFEAALERNGDLAAAHFGMAVALREKSGALRAVQDHLRKCIELSPNFAEAHYVLGQIASVENRFENAVEHLQRAAAAYPRMAAYWQSLALAHHKLKQTEFARRAAHKAYFAASTEQEIRMALATLDQVDGRQVQLAAAQKADVAALAVIAERRGDTKLEGTLIRVDCLGEAARFHVLAGEKRVLLYSLRPQEISLRNFAADTREFVCGPQKRLAVSVEYNALPNAALRSAGDVVAIELKAN